MNIQKRIVAAVLCLATLALFGCSLEDETISVTTNEKPLPSASESVIEASSYDELKERLLYFIKERIETGLVRINSYEGGDEIREDANRACIELQESNPYAAYAVSSMTGKANKVVSFYEVVFEIYYKNDVTKKQLDSINTVPTLRYLKSVLEDSLTGYVPSLTVLTMNIPLTQEDIEFIVQEIYYDNPMEIVMMPIPSVKFYPEFGTERIAEFTFVYRYEASTLKIMTESLEKKDRDIAETVTGNDADIILSLCQKLMGITEYDTEIAEGEYSNQNKAATAYGALIEGSAIGEGYAMAFKSLCDELDFDCVVVIGDYKGNPHAWNIVALVNPETGLTDYYHIDPSMCDVNGIATAFLKSDAEMEEDYAWNRSKYMVCDGPLSYTSLTKTEYHAGESPAPTTYETPEPTTDVSPEPTADESPEPTADESPEPTT